jgi:hypothetical protein
MGIAMGRVVEPHQERRSFAKQPWQSVYGSAARFVFVHRYWILLLRRLRTRFGDAMKLPRLLCVSVAALTALAGYSQARPAPQDNAGPSQSDFIAAYRRAHDARDVEAMRKLYCWDGVTPEIKDITERYAYDFEDKIRDIKLTSEHPKDRPSQYAKDGVTYGFDLPVVLELVVEYPAPTKGAHNTNYYPVGVKDGHYLIAVMVPKQGVAPLAANAVAAPNRAAKADAPTHAGQTSASGQSIVVPGETTLTVRLTQPVGERLAGIGGGAFSATLAESVELNGVTMIPVGAVVQGMVTKESDYSPQLALSSVTVNGTVRRIETTTITFNQRIEYPAGTELSFKLIRPLNLQK